MNKKVRREVMAVKTEKQEYMGGTQGDQNQQDLVTDGMWGRREATKSKNICTQRYAKYTSYSSSDPHSSLEGPVIRNKCTQTGPKSHGEEVMGSGCRLRFSDPKSISLFIAFHGLKGWMTERLGGWQRKRTRLKQREKGAAGGSRR